MKLGLASSAVFFAAAYAGSSYAFTPASLVSSSKAFSLRQRLTHEHQLQASVEAEVEENSAEPFFVEDANEIKDLPLSQQLEPDGVTDAPLMRDIEMLSSMLEEVVKQDNPVAHDLYTRFRQHGLNRAMSPSDAEPLERMIKCSKDISPENALAVMNTFSLALNLINSAEVHHRLRKLRRSELESEESSSLAGPLPRVKDSARGTIDAIVAENETKGISKSQTQKEIYDKLLSQKVEIVLTAHPTEVNRRTVLRKYRKITETLAKLDRPDIHPFERTEAMSKIRGLIAGLWGTNVIRLAKPTVQQEAAGGIAIIETVLWDAVPAYLRKLDAQVEESLDRRLPVDEVPLKFGSWIGGDRDGNPNVTPAVTQEVVTQQRLRAAKLILNDLNELYAELAVSARFSDEMKELAATITDSSDEKELYRRVIGRLRQRMVKTIKECETRMSATSTVEQSAMASAVTKHIGGWESIDGIYQVSELMEPLKVMYNSLSETGFELVADGLLADIIRRLSVFGLTLVPLDIREESTQHTNALDAITRYLGVGSYAEWDEQTKLNFLQAELSGKRPLFRTRELDSFGFDETVVKTLKTFHTISQIEPEALGAYVISQARSASDVLAVMLLQKQFGLNPEKGNMLRVVPLFETLNDLNNGSDVMDTLFSIPTYAGAIKGKQEVMVGYSDSAKDAGRLAACWAQYESQEKMVNVAAKHDIELTFFHGKGGTVGRGGNPALYRAVLSHPPGTINGRFRVTEQGEMITQNFGTPRIAERTLDIYTSAVLRESFTEHVEPTQSWRDQMARVSEVSCADYRFVVREEPRFVPYFRQATPELELGSLNIGSRPAKRNPKGGIESLRAIPWTFAWTQTRLHLSAWLGVAEGLSSDNKADREELKEMYNEWPWFKEIIDLVTMILSKTDYSISKNYDDQLVTDPDSLTLGVEVRKKLEDTRRAVLDVQGSTDYAGEHVAIMRASSKIRNPYVDPINAVQAEMMKRLRAMDEEDDTGMTAAQLEEKQNIKDALIISINGIAQGMRNSG